MLSLKIIMLKCSENIKSVSKTRYTVCADKNRLNLCVPVDLQAYWRSLFQPLMRCVRLCNMCISELQTVWTACSSEVQSVL